MYALALSSLEPATSEPAVDVSTPSFAKRSRRQYGSYSTSAIPQGDVFRRKWADLIGIHLKCPPSQCHVNSDPTDLQKVSSKYNVSAQDWHEQEAVPLVAAGRADLAAHHNATM